MTDKATTITITGKVGYEDDITPTQAAQIIAFLESGDGATATPTLGDSVLGNPSGKRGAKKVESARDALDISGAKTNPQKIVALGAYVLQDGGETFKVEDVKAAFRRARENAPANFTRDLDGAIGSGWIGEESSGEYLLTAKVDGVLDGGFAFPKSTNGGKARKSTSAPKAAKGKVGGKPEIFADIDVFPTTLEGFAPYAKMKFEKDKLLWALHLAKTLGVNGLNNKHIEWLTDHLGSGIPNGHITAAFNAVKKAGNANKSTQDGTIRITPDGERYLATIGSFPAGD